MADAAPKPGSETEPAGKVRDSAVLEISENNLLPTALGQVGTRWGDEAALLRSAPTPLAPAALVLSAMGLLLALFSFFWPALLMAPLVFGSGLICSYLAFFEIRQRGLSGWRPAVIGWLLGYLAVLCWHFFLFQNLQPFTEVVWLRSGADFDEFVLIILIGIGLMHVVFLRLPSASAIAVIGVLVLTVGTLVLAVVLESQRQSRETVATKRLGDVALGLHQWMETGQQLQPPGYGEKYLRQLRETSARLEKPPPQTTETEGVALGLLLAAGTCGLLMIGIVGLNVWSRLGPRDLFRDASMVACGTRPNCVSSKAKERDKRIEPIHFDCPAEEAWQRLLIAVSAQPRCQIEIQQPGYVYATFRAKHLRVVDDAEFRLDPDAGVIDCRSASRVGYSDLGANRERIEGIRKDFQAKYIMLS